MKVLVTGGAGFIGSHLVDALLEREYQVTIIDNMITGQPENINPAARFYEMDIRGKDVHELFEKEQFDVVFHQAAQMDVRKSVGDPGYDADVNIIGTLNLLQASVETGVKKFMFASSGGAIYGEQVEFPATEEHPTWPSSPYGVAKLSCEKYIYSFGLTFGLQYQLMRYANVYGPRQNAHGEAGVVAIFCEKLLSGQQPIINGDGKQTRDFVHVADVVRANMLALDYPKSDYFNVGTGIETDVNTIFYRLNEATGAGMPEKHGEPKAGEQQRSVLSYEKAKRLLGWEPQVEIGQGLAETVAFFRQKRLAA